MASPSVNRGTFDVEADRGVVTLSGTVPSVGTKKRAVRLAVETPSVLRVNDRLGVDSTARRATKAVVPDERLGRQVAETLAGEVFEDATAEENWFYGWEVEGTDGTWQVDVSADEGVVSLPDAVPAAPRDVRRAVDSLRRLEGVRAVETSHYVVGDPYRRRYGPYPYGWATPGPSPYPPASPAYAPPPYGPSDLYPPAEGPPASRSASG